MHDLAITPGDSWEILPRLARDNRPSQFYQSALAFKAHHAIQVGDELDGGPVLPGFRMTLAALFEVQGDGPTPAA